MCEVYLDPAELWQETEHKARTAKVCEACHGVIRVSDRYLRHFSKRDGGINSGVMCLPCKADRSEFADAHDHLLPTPSYFPILLSECIAEDDESSRWLEMRERMRARRAQSATNAPPTSKPAPDTNRPAT